jgi:hypothetical protein
MEKVGRRHPTKSEREEMMKTQTLDDPPPITATWLQCLGLSRKSAEAVVKSHREENEALVSALIQRWHYRAKCCAVSGHQGKLMQREILGCIKDLQTAIAKSTTADKGNSTE